MAFNPTKKLEEKETEEFTPTKKVASNTMDPWMRAGYQTLGGAVGGYLTGGNPWGIGLGSGIFGQYWDLSQEYLGRKEPKGLMKRSIGAAEDIIFDVVSPVAMAKGIYHAKRIGADKLLSPLKKLARPQQMAKYQFFGLKPSAATATQSPMLIRMENALADYFFSASPLIASAQRNVEALKFSANFLAREYGDILTKEEMGILLKKAAPKAIKQLDAVYNKLFSRIAKDIGPETQHIVNTRDMLKKLIGETTEGPSSGIAALAEEITKKADKMGGGLGFDVIKKYRSKIGEMMKSPFLISTRNIQSGDLKRLYAALSIDMEIAALKAGAKTHAKWRAANKYFDISLKKQVPILEEILKKGYDQEAFNVVMKGAEAGGQRLAALRRQMSKKEWDTVSGTILGRLGLAKPAAQDAAGTVFSIETFLTNWNKISPQAKKQLFKYGPHERLSKELDSLASVMGDFRKVGELANKSKTGSVLMFFSVINTIGSVAGGSTGAALGGSAGATAGAVGGMVTATTLGYAPRKIAKLLTNAKFVRWLASGIKISKTRPDVMKIHLGRLFAIRASDPDIKEEINELIALNLEE
jgi:hypothetical protein